MWDATANHAMPASQARAVWQGLRVLVYTRRELRKLGAEPPMRHLTSTKQIERGWMESVLFPLCEKLRSRGYMRDALDGKAVYCLFYEPSFLTRTSFERAVEILGGAAYHTEDASQFFPVNTPRYVDNVVGLLASMRVDLVVLRSSESGVLDTAARADALPIVSGGSRDDHPTQALADMYTLRREVGGLDGINLAVVGRLEHRNVSALLTGLALFEDARVTLMPFSGQASPDVVSYCEERGVDVRVADSSDPGPLSEMDAIYLNGPRTLAHAELLRSRGANSLRIDADLMARLKEGCVILDPMQRSGDFDVSAQDPRLAFYRQAENALLVRMALLLQILG